MINLHCHITKVDEIRENFKHSIPVTDHDFTLSTILLHSPVSNKTEPAKHNKWKVCSCETENIQSY